MSSAGTTSTGSQEFEYSDATTFACFLCSRGLKTLDQLKRHNAESDLHKARTLRIPLSARRRPV